MVAQWVAALPEVEVARRRLDHASLGSSDAAPECVFDPDAHGRPARVPRRRRRRSTRRRSRVKVQVTGPLTLGTALHAAGMPGRARSAAPRSLHARMGRRARGARCATRLPGSRARPVLRRAGARARGGAGTGRSTARPRSTCCRARSLRSTAPPVCTCAATATSGSRSKPDPRSLGVEVRDDLAARHGRDRALPRRRRLDRVGRGARPTARSVSRPIRTGGGSPRCGASSRDAAAIPCRCAPAG